MKSTQSLIFHSAIFSLVLECFTIDKEGRLGRQTRNPVFQPKLENEEFRFTKPRPKTPYMKASQKGFPGGM